MRAILILIVAAILGFFGYQYAANGKGPGDAISALTGNANEMADGAATAASASGCRPLLQGVMVEWPLATPTMGLSKSCSL